MTGVDASLTVHLGSLPADHEAVVTAVADLRADLQRAPQLRTRERHTGETGTKGAVVDLVVTLAGSSSLAAVAKIVQLWLSRDRRRSLTVSFQKNGKETRIIVEGDPISTDNLTDALSAAVHVDESTESG
jgi:hypothetical protein